MGRTQSWDNAWDLFAMSKYNTITSLDESALVPGLLYVGTDDGLVQVSEDDGASWRATEVGSMPGVPATAFVNHIYADLHDANTVYVVLDNHKYGDLNPYVLKSTNRGSQLDIAGGRFTRADLDVADCTGSCKSKPVIPRARIWAVILR